MLNQYEKLITDKPRDNPVSQHGNYSIRERINTTSNPDYTYRHSNLIDDYLKDEAFKEELANILKKHNIDMAEGGLQKGGFSWCVDIGEGQVLHMSTQYRSRKPHIRHLEPEILQPLVKLHDDINLKIEVLPKVKTEGVNDGHVVDLISSLAKKDLLFADPQKTNVGLIEGIPVVIGDGSVIKMDKDSAELGMHYYERDNDNFNHFIKSDANKCLLDLHKNGCSGKNILKAIKNYNDYTHHPWVDKQTEKWAQNQYIEDKGLKKGEAKGIIPREEIESLLKRELSPVAREIIELSAEHSLREKDLKQLAAQTIEKKWGDKFPDKQSLTTFAAGVKNDKDSSPAL